MKFILLLGLNLFLLLPRVWASDRTTVDSTLSAILAQRMDSTQVKRLNDLAFESRRFDPLMTFQIAEKALAISQEIGYEYDVPRCYNFMGVAHDKQGNYATAHDYYIKAVETALKVRNKEQLAHAYHNLGKIYNWRDDYAEALEYYYKALKIFEDLNDDYGQGYIHNSLSLTFSHQKHQQAALEHANLALTFRQKINDELGIQAARNRLAEIYIDMKKYDEALVKLFHNVKFYESKNDLDGLSVTFLNISEIYLAAEEYNKAVHFAKKALDYYSEIGNESMVSVCQLRVAQVYVEMGEEDRAKDYAKLALRNSKKYQRKEVELETYLVISKIYEKKEKYKEALEFYKNYNTLKDSLFNAESYQQSGWLKGSFDLFKKEVENKRLKEKEASNKAVIQRQRIQNWTLIGGLTLFVALMFVLIRSNQLRQRDNLLLKYQNQQIEQQKEAIAQQSQAISEAQEQLRRYNEELEGKVEERTQALKKSNEELELYANLASHDLKQPLRSIASFAQLLSRHLTRQQLMDGEVKEYVNFIVDSTRYMHHLINDLLAFSKFSQSHDVGSESFECLQMIENVKQNLYEQIKESGTTILLLQLPDEVFGVKIKIIQLFQNLISNAIKFKKNDRPAVICIDCKDLETHWQFSIADNGIGIEKDYFQVIFEAFKKLHSKQQYAGVGLGLSTCKKIVEQHHGEIWVESVFGEGTTFHFTLAKKGFEAGNEAE